jgi:choline dehydrogenase
VSRSYDYIVVKAETAGCIVAARLSEDPTVGLHIAQVSIHRGLRWSTTRAYLRRAARRPNSTCGARLT